MKVEHDLERYPDGKPKVYRLTVEFPPDAEPKQSGTGKSDVWWTTGAPDKSSVAPFSVAGSLFSKAGEIGAEKSAKASKAKS